MIDLKVYTFGTLKKTGNPSSFILPQSLAPILKPFAAVSNPHLLLSSISCIMKEISPHPFLMCFLLLEFVNWSCAVIFLSSVIIYITNLVFTFINEFIN